MKPFMKFGFWVLLVFMFLVGVFFIQDFGLLNQSPVVSDVDAQMSERLVNYYTSSGSYSRAYTGAYDLGMAPQNILFSRESFPGIQFEGQRGVSHPGDVLFESHPGDYMFYQSFFPGDIIIDGSKDGSSGKTKMRTIMTCGGCAQTMATCDWDCGATFSYCNMGSPYGGGGYTGLIRPGYTDMICDGENTYMACTSGFCVIGGNTLMTCSGGIFCDWSGGNTSRTCNVFGCRASGANVVYPGGGNTFITCSSSLYGLCGGQIGGIYGGGLTRIYCGTSIGVEQYRLRQASPPPPF